MTFGADKRLAFPLFYLSLLVCQQHCLRFQGALKNVLKKFSSLPLLALGSSFSSLSSSVSYSGLSLILGTSSATSPSSILLFVLSSSESGCRINSRAWKLLKICCFAITKFCASQWAAISNLDLVSLFFFITNFNLIISYRFVKHCQMMQEGFPLIWV